MDISTILAGFIFGVIGFYLLKFAKKASSIPLYLISISLMIYPYFVEGQFAMWSVGCVLCALAYWFAKQA